MHIENTNDEILRNIDTLRYVKTWAEQRPTLVGRAAMSAVFGSVIAIGSNYAMLGPLLSGAAVSALALSTIGMVRTYTRYCITIAGEYGTLFNSKKQARTVTTAAVALLKELDCPHVLHVLKKGLSNLDYHVRRNGMATPKPTLAGSLLDCSDKLPLNDAAALAVIMREALFDYITGAFPKHDTCSRYPLVSDHLPMRLQKYVSDVCPEMIVHNPQVFNAQILNTAHPGFYQVVQGLLALSCSSKELKQGVHTWLTVQREQASTHIGAKSLPNDLVL